MTVDRDFKKLIRARMAKTGESYATAREHLLRQQPTASKQAETRLPGTSFRLASDGAFERAQSAVTGVAATLYDDAGAELADGTLHVWMGRPPAFEIAIPLTAIKEVQRTPDGKPGTSLGVHGGRGRWLVNASYENLVTLSLKPPQSAAVMLSSSMPEAIKQSTPRALRLLLRDRKAKVRQLTISVDDPDELLSALSTELDPSSHRGRSTGRERSGGD